MRRYPFTSPLPPPLRVLCRSAPWIGRAAAIVGLTLALILALNPSIAGTSSVVSDTSVSKTPQLPAKSTIDAPIAPQVILSDPQTQDAPALAAPVNESGEPGREPGMVKTLQAAQDVRADRSDQAGLVDQADQAAPPKPLLTPSESHRQVLAQCFIDAGKRFKVDPYLLLSIKQVESGKSLDPAITGHNKNGTIDMGLMQINSIWLRNPFIQAAGIKKNHLYDPCININVGAWILSQEIARHGMQEGIGRYHSATPKFKNRYRAKVLAEYAKFARRKTQAKNNTVIASKD